MIKDNQEINGHYAGGDKDVGDAEIDQEIVGHGAKIPEHCETNAYHKITSDGCKNQNHHEKSSQYSREGKTIVFIQSRVV